MQHQLLGTPTKKTIGFPSTQKREESCQEVFKVPSFKKPHEDPKVKEPEFYQSQFYRAEEPKPKDSYSPENGYDFSYENNDFGHQLSFGSRGNSLNNTPMKGESSEMYTPGLRKESYEIDPVVTPSGNQWGANKYPFEDGNHVHTLLEDCSTRGNSNLHYHQQNQMKPKKLFEYPSPINADPLRQA
jgi:hypothetical protein